MTTPDATASMTIARPCALNACATGRFPYPNTESEMLIMGKLWDLTCRLLLIASCLSLIATAIAMTYLYPNVCLIAAAVMLWRFRRRRFGSGWVHGVAKTAGWDELYRGNLLGSTGTIIGTTEFLSPPTRRYALAKLMTAPLNRSGVAVRMFFASFRRLAFMSTMLIRLPDACHLATFARTGGGKGVSIVIPTLLADSRSMVITDPKRENFLKTALHRKNRYGHRIVLLDPFGPHSDCFNPLDMIDHNSPDFIDQTKDLAAALVIKNDKETQPHFPESAERILQAFIAFVCVSSTDRKLRNLQTVRELVSSRERYEATKRLMQNSGNIAGGMLARLGHGLSWHQDREEASVLSTVQRFTSFLDSPQIAANTCQSTFNPRELLKGKMSIYLALPANRLKSHAAIQRMWISSIMGSLTHNTNERLQTLFLLDEIGNMGHLQVLEDAVTMYRGMGIRLHFIFQGIGQVKELFGADGANTFLDNIGSQIFFNVQSYDTAEAISKRCGDATVASESEQTGSSYSRPSDGPGPGKQGGSHSTNRSRTISELARKLLKPEEILTLNPEACVCFHLHHAPILARLVKYYRSPIFRSPVFGRLRTGRSRGLSLASGMVAALLLAVSLGIAYGLAVMPPIYATRPSGYPTGRYQKSVYGALSPSKPLPFETSYAPKPGRFGRSR